jgi:GT2 family glycosyltransferase
MVLRISADFIIWWRYAKMRASVVIPTYCRGAKLMVTLESLLGNSVTGIDQVEIIVVDDGSPTPAKPFVEKCEARIPFELHYIRQANAGPAAARNRGFRAGHGEIVIFVDDDIICPPDMIKLHIAAHMAHPGSVICGRCPFLEPLTITPLSRFINSLGLDAGEGAVDEYLPISIVASGQMSVERSMFEGQSGVYRDDLATPAAEEFELSYRLRERGVPILQATRIIARHDHPTTLESICRQQFKHALGCAEAAARYPATLGLPDLANMIGANTGTARGKKLTIRLKFMSKRLLAMSTIRTILLRLGEHVERLAPIPGLLAPLYRAVIGLHFIAGLREGTARFSKPAGPRPC